MPVAYLAAEGLIAPLLEALADRVVAVQGRLVLASAATDEAAWWAANTWLEPQWRRIASIGDGAKWLRSMQRNWACHAIDWFRRVELIVEKLPPLKAKPRPFPFELPDAPMGNWTLWQKDLMLASARCSSPFANGEIEFEDDKTGPPSRAFKKLQEALTVLRARPQPGQRCLDLGACPGGWTWVLQRLGAEVVAVDKAPLDPAVLALPGVTQRVESAFGLDPKEVGPVDWLFSDVICYPRRLLDLIVRWRDSSMCRRFVCTIKFQGADEHAIAREFAALPGAKVMHLHHNKHELTFALLDEA
ncbi:MAG: hypothetical protein H6835_09635 [Planctomycetes bacterium]|nr:hypothetical protein [Planctomycetota bacterium]